MNNLKEIKQLKNRYFIIRHGQSEANVKGIILSDPKNGIPNFGLTPEGKKQAIDSIKKSETLDNNTIIFSSDFKRAKETAEIAKDILKTSSINYTNFLHERFFGNFERTHDKNYKIIWEHDKVNPDHEFNNVESVNHVQERTTKLIVNLEKKYQDKNILLVAHGDSLQILQTGFKKVCPSNHRELKHLNTAEIRELILTKC